MHGKSRLKSYCRWADLETFEAAQGSWILITLEFVIKPSGAALADLDVAIEVCLHGIVIFGHWETRSRIISVKGVTQESIETKECIHDRDVDQGLSSAHGCKRPMERLSHWIQFSILSYRYDDDTGKLPGHPKHLNSNLSLKAPKLFIPLSNHSTKPLEQP